MKVENKTIIITDPCYIIKKSNQDDWDACEWGDCMENLGFTNFLSDSTEYGDWSCVTYNSDTGKVLGEFCADAGMVGVFELDEVLKYNPDFNYHIEKPYLVTTIPNFTGEVRMIWSPEFEGVSVIGTGNINFHTMQTG